MTMCCVPLFSARVALVAVAFALLAGCASSLSQKIATGYSTADAYLARTERLYDAKVIDIESAQKRLDQVKLVKSTLDAASVEYVKCVGAATPADKCMGAVLNLGVAQGVLSELELYLIARSKQ